MTRASTRSARCALLLALALGGCGPYAQLGQKLDVTPRLAGGVTWIAAAASDRTEIRVLIIGKPDGSGAAPFSYTSMPVLSGMTLQGTWTEVGSAGDVTVQVAHTYTLPDERSRTPLNRAGSQRDDTPRTIQLTATRDNAGRLVIAGDPAIAGTYAALAEALGRLGTATEHDAACAYQAASLGIKSSEIRIIGFGGAGMLQYQNAATFVGTMSGSVRVSMSGYLHNTTRIEYESFEDLGGVVVSGAQVTDADLSGDGHMSGLVSFTLTGARPGGSGPAPTITATVDYGGAGNPANTVQISNGDPAGGFYVTTIAGGGTALVPATAVTAASPPVADCLGLP